MATLTKILQRFREKYQLTPEEQKARESRHNDICQCMDHYAHESFLKYIGYAIIEPFYRRANSRWPSLR